MALTITNLSRDVVGTKAAWSADITFDSSYATGGEALTPGQLGLRSVTFFDAENRKGYSFEYDRTNSKLKAFNGTTEISNATDLSAVTTRVRALGTE